MVIESFGCGCLAGVGATINTIAKKYNTSPGFAFSELFFSGATGGPITGLQERPTVPAIQDKVWMSQNQWLLRHALLNQPKRDSDCQLVFLGDSLTEGWLTHGAILWKTHYVDLYRAINLGIGGDEVQHVMWRVQNGALDNLSPKVIVLQIGTNNLGNSGHKARETANGIRLLLDELYIRLPSTKIALLGVFPRDVYPGSPLRQEVSALNNLIKDFHDGRTVFYLDIGKCFLAEDGSISPGIMPDYLHLSPEGYQVWADSMNVKLTELNASLCTVM